MADTVVTYPTAIPTHSCLTTEPRFGRGTWWPCSQGGWTLAEPRGWIIISLTHFWVLHSFVRPLGWPSDPSVEWLARNLHQDATQPPVAYKAPSLLYSLATLVAPPLTNHLGKTLEGHPEYLPFFLQSATNYGWFCLPHSSQHFSCLFIPKATPPVQASITSLLPTRTTS